MILKVRVNLLTLCLKTLAPFAVLETLGHKLNPEAEAVVCRVWGGERG